MQFPKEMFGRALVVGVPSTYVHYKANAVAHVKTVVPIDLEGHLDLDFKGMTMEMKPSGLPQRAIIMGFSSA